MTHTNKKIIAITGGIATGKSTVSKILKEKSYEVIDADKIAKALMKKNEVSYKKTLEFFGKSILKSDGEIDRKVLGRKVFGNPQLLSKLNDLTHGDIFEEMNSSIKNSREKIIFLDIPLFFEAEESIMKKFIKIDEIWIVYSDRNTQIERIIDRDNFTKDEATKRVDSQISIELKKEWADRIIYNLDSIEGLKDQIDLLLKDLS